MKSSVALRRSILLKQSACACLLCPRCGALLAHNVYLQTNDNHRQGDLNHYFIVLYLFENLEQFYLCHDNDQD